MARRFHKLACPIILRRAYRQRCTEYVEITRTAAAARYTFQSGCSGRTCRLGLNIRTQYVARNTYSPSRFGA
jgi:hypothetical protein